MRSDKSDQLKEEAENEIWSRKVKESTIEVIEADTLQTENDAADFELVPSASEIRYVNNLLYTLRYILLNKV
ncbi:unnamed protein product [Gongylonema pulchrum]|uniref:Retrovirus-related Pol polyprotein from transposon TNT 1-94 n=1 Tax=Gongylonema pulchrum TaxID=637853 RepID=A0A183DMN9_9BILA|nr:unnamed protein product [Gongylonema pulchrum]